MSASPPSSSPLAVPLSVGEVQVIDVAGEPYVVLSPVLRALGLSVEGQTQRLRRQPWAARTCMTHGVVAADGNVRPATVVAVQAFLMLMATIDSARVAPAVREQVIAYQCETADAIGAYWTRGVAVNPRGRSPVELAVLQSGRGLGDAFDHLQRFHYFDQVATGAREDPEVPQGTARDRATAAARQAYGRLVEPTLRILSAGGDDESDPS